MADKRIFNLTEASTAGDNDLLALDNSNFPETKKIKVSKLRAGYVQKHDIAILDNLAGTTNTTGSTIRKGTYFYLDGVLCVALADIAAGATFTFETNYDFATVGEELTDIKQTLTEINNDWLRRGNFYSIAASANSNNLDAFAIKLGITASTTFTQLCDLATSQLANENCATVVVNSNNANLTTSAPQFLQDICSFFNITSVAIGRFEVNIVDQYNKRVEIWHTDRNLTSIDIVRVDNGVAGTVKHVALS